MSENPHEMRYLEERLQEAENRARQNARIADHMTSKLAAALNALKPHDPEMVTELMGIPKAEEPAPEDAASAGADQAPA